MKISWNLAALKARAANLKADVAVLASAARDPRVPMAAKLVIAFVAAYALSPIDLIPDFIPVIGYLDDLIIVPAGIALAIRMIPPSVLDDHRARLAAQPKKPGTSIFGAALVITTWLATAALIFWWVR